MVFIKAQHSTPTSVKYPIEREGRQTTMEHEFLTKLRNTIHVQHAIQ